MNKPWLKYYGKVPEKLDYPDMTMYRALRHSAEKYPQYRAYDFLGLKSSYRQLMKDIDRCAHGLVLLGVKPGDSCTICMPNTPQAIIMFYALNKIGALSSMIHPLSSSKEIEEFINISGSKWAFTLDAFYNRFREGMSKGVVTKLILARLGDYMKPLTATLFFLAKGKKIPKVPPSEDILWWGDLMALPEGKDGSIMQSQDLSSGETCSILYSGGTTGTPKGIELTSLNFNALATQVGVQLHNSEPMTAGDSILAILPIFHGFGLAVCVHGFLLHGGELILVPQFSADVAAKLIKKKKPSVIAGVPTLFEALIHNKTMQRADLSCLKGVFGGGDKVPHSIKSRFDNLLKNGGSTTELREGYGLTESVTVALLMPEGEYRQGSIGVPISDMAAKIVRPESQEEQPFGEEGEICIAGPTLMKGYRNEPEETAAALQIHGDGRQWLHTGDLGTMDRDGFVYFKLRMKRMIKVSGMAVYPTQVEEVLDGHGAVNMACAIGVHDDYQMQHVKAFVVLNEGNDPTDELKGDLIDHCRSRINKWSCPREIEFRSELPMTRVGKIAYTELEKEEKAKASCE